jgi:hypothetical protein
LKAASEPRPTLICERLSRYGSSRLSIVKSRRFLEGGACGDGITCLV